MIKKILNKLQLRHKLIILNLIITGIVFLVSAMIIFVTEIFSFKNSLLRDLTAQANIVAGSSTACLAFNDQKTARENLAVLKTSPNIECAVIYTADGTIFASFWRPGLDIRPPPIPVPKDGHYFTGNDLSIVDGIVLDKVRLGTIYIRSDLKKLYSMMLRHGLITLITLLLSFVVAYQLISRWQKVIEEPIMQLYQVMKLVSWEQNYTLKAEVYSQDEIGSLAQGFNAMLAQIRERDVKLRKEIAERRRAEEEVRRLNEELELKVEKKTKQLLEAREELLRKEKLVVLGQLSGSVGHELRNPLGVMNNAVYFLKNVVPESNGTIREYLDIIKQEIDNSQRIISDLLDFSRTKKPQAEVIAVHELVRNSIERCVIPEKVELKTSLPEMLPSVKVDPLQMSQVLQNLITNAVQAMPDGGVLNVVARQVQDSRFKDQGSEHKNIERGAFNLEHDTDFIEISIEDTGGGISPDNMNKLFQPLFTTKARGIGLGLTVCKNLTEANGGRIEAESREGEGSRFAILLPAEG